MFVGITMVVTGAYMDASSGEGQANTAYDNIFRLALAVSVIGLVLLLIRLLLKRRK